MAESKKSVLIVGVGSIGERHLRCFQQTCRADLAICEINDTLRAEVASRYEINRVFATLDEALKHPLDAAVIATPASFHIPLAIETAKRGLHLLIEKPLSTSTDGVSDLAHVCAQQGNIAAVAYVMRCHPALAAAREAVLSGRFGRPLQVVVVSGQNFPFYRPAYRDTYYSQRSSGGGAIQDALTHFINAVEWIAGPTTCVLADAAHLAIPDVAVEDTVHVLARHGDVLAAYSLNQHQQPNESTVTIICERGVVRVMLHDNRWAYAMDPTVGWTEQSFDSLQRDDLFIRQASAFLDAIAGDAQVLCSLAEGAATLHANLSILRAADRPPWIVVPNSPRKPVQQAVETS
jgi:predicted dehydrogenase